MEAWTASDADGVRRAAYRLLLGFAADPDSALTDAESLGWLDRIGNETHQSPNWSRESMLTAPVATGLRSEALYAPAMATSSGFGKVEVFHGDQTTCKTHGPVKLLSDSRTRIRPYCIEAGIISRHDRKTQSALCRTLEFPDGSL